MASCIAGWKAAWGTHWRLARAIDPLVCKAQRKKVLRHFSITLGSGYTCTKCGRNVYNRYGVESQPDVPYLRKLRRLAVHAIDCKGRSHDTPEGLSIAAGFAYVNALLGVQ